ncbi:hypothetical protein EHM69_11690 [candidate division KSB1 bacterium]|nr:MAG: hypothetical protein EHM69_11690 [candidate division KSB1 bacterium]
MKRLSKLLFAVALLLPFVISTAAFAQCGAHMLAALDEDNPVLPGQRYDVSVWTNSPFCPANGQISIQTIPPGSALIAGDPYWVESFFDVFTEVETVKPPIVPLVPPGSPPFQIITEITFDDPAYPMFTHVETVVVNMMNRLEIVHPAPCADNVPPMMALGNSICFVVCHRIYTIPLMTNPGEGQPIISVTPGCMPPCTPMACTPGDPNSYRYDVYQSGGQWYLEFEYSDISIEPVCYCVSYTGNLPLNGQTYALGGWENERQTHNVSVWTNNSIRPVNGAIEIYSYPTGAQFEGGGGGGGGYRIDSFFDVFMEPYTFDPPVGPGIFTPGQQFQLIGYIHFDPPGPVYPPMWVVEDVIVTPSGGLQLVNPGCGPVVVPSIIQPGIPECLTVCHDIYHIPLNCAPTTTPVVTVYSGCDATTPCNNPVPCTPGAMTDFRFDVYLVGGTWILEFEYSNEMIQPVCYCVDVTCAPGPGAGAVVLGAINPWHPTFNLSVRSTDEMVPIGGTISLRSEPPGAIFGYHVDSFFDIFLESFSQEIPVDPGIFIPGDVFQIVAEIEYFGPGSDPFEGQVAYTENVIVTPSGGLALWDPITPCTGDVVPAAMPPGMSVCFKVCHRVYEVVLNSDPTLGRPIIQVTPGCFGPPNDNCLPEACVPGGPDDYVYDIYFNGVDWILRFEYSNPYIEPVCYCVTYIGQVPNWNTHELVALDELYSTFDITTWATGLTDPFDNLSGQITVFSAPAGAFIGPYMGTFSGVREDWYTIEVPVGAGSFTPGSTFELVAYYDYTLPDFPDVWKTELVQVLPDGRLAIWDRGGECTGEIVPSWMMMGQSECFKVCHRIYHIGLSAYDPAHAPTVRVQPGCFGLPQDPCLPDPSCIPGGPNDYRYVVVWNGSNWELEFEYSNPNREPVCYCVTIIPPPCRKVNDLVILIPNPPLHNNVTLFWTCPQMGLYQIYSTVVRNNDGNPPGPDWTLEDSVPGNSGDQITWQPMAGTVDPYRNYVIIVDCDPVLPTK